MSSAYSRDTELRNVQSNDLYHLAVILDDDDYWQKLMETIPKDINNQIIDTASNTSSDYTTSNGRKYTNDHIRLIQNAFRRSGESRLCPQILFDEWGSSGRKHERPTLGVLLHLLLKAHLFRAADYVAESLLRECKPSRPTEGPGAEITCELPSSVFADIGEMANDSQNYPDTELLQQNAKFGSSLMDINKDYYTKYRDPINNKHFAPPLGNDNGVAPKPPPRSQRIVRLLKKQQQHHKQERLHQVQQTANITNNHDIFTVNEYEQPQQPSNNVDATLTTTDNLPKISLLMNSINSTRDDSSLAYEDSTPKISFLIGDSISQASEELYTPNDTPNLAYSNNIEPSLAVGDDQQHNHDLPAISALNLYGERDNTSQHFSSIDNVPSVALNFYDKNHTSCSNDKNFNVPCVVEEIRCEISPHESHVELMADVSNLNKEEEENIADDDNDDADVPNLSIFNDSSLTSVTNTSGGNSFEQSVYNSRPTSSDNALPLNVFQIS